MKDEIAAVLEGRAAWAVVQADCVEAMPAMPEASVDAIITDPPYGLGFMNREWDRFAEGLPNAEAWKGRRADTRVEPGSGRSKDAPGARFPGGLYGGRNIFRRCRKCGKREFSGSPCKCPEKDWQYEAPASVPVHMVVFQRWSEKWAREALRVIKPGGHLLAFGGTRTSHRLVCALEDAGFEIRNTLMWVYGGGFPKSLDVSKIMDRAAGAEHEDLGPHPAPNATGWITAGKASDNRARFTAPSTTAAKRWQGWGTALKPAWEPIILARKPLSEPNVAANVFRHGTGGLNVDGCRIETPEITERPSDINQAVYGRDDKQGRVRGSLKGRWPPNFLLIHSPGCKRVETKQEVEDWSCVPGCPVAALDAQSGELVSGSGTNFVRKTAKGYKGNVYGTHSRPEGIQNVVYGDSGGASRFFPRFSWEEADFVPFLYCPKADRAERDMGLDAKFPKKMLRWSSGDQNPGRFQSEGTDKSARNFHPTVKPLALMQWLCRLVTPTRTPDGQPGLILDPFVGSGSTVISALREGFRCVGIEREEEYVIVARARVVGDAPLLNSLVSAPPDEKTEPEKG